ncbi:MAG TPA: hypothetical protein PLO62_10250 [Candidatus Hydrogenedentes bacterium]|nr:hypothetical protein [Candidatus Hydrogenedentota bacterium]HOS02938.1 hypothetical protein [Candidatus Hydrogenedentota bacterium]
MRVNKHKWVVVAVALVVMLGIATSAHAAKRVLLVGDSWAQLMWKYKSLSTNFKSFGVGFATEDGTFTAIGATTAAFWAGNIGSIQAQLAANPTIDCVDLVIGGNDMWVWNTSWSEAQKTALLDSVQANLWAICQACLAVRPNIQVVLHGYDYINLFDTVMKDPFGAAGLLWFGLGQPMPAQINWLFLGLDERKKALTAYNPRIKYVQCNGTLQVVGGYSANIPGQAPGYVPWPGGDPNLPSPIKFFAPLSGGKYDPIHLSQEGYKWHSWMATAAFYNAWFRTYPY